MTADQYAGKLGRNFRANLRRHLKARSRNDFCTKAEMSLSQLSDLLGAKASDPRLRTIEHVARVLGVSPRDLLDEPKLLK